MLHVKHLIFLFLEIAWLFLKILQSYFWYSINYLSENVGTSQNASQGKMQVRMQMYKCIVINNIVSENEWFNFI